MAHEADLGAVQRLINEGATLVEVLPEAEYREEHLPGAINVPLKQHRRGAGRWAIRWANPAVLGRIRPVLARYWSRPVGVICRYFPARRRDERHASHARAAASKPAAPIIETAD